MRDSKREQFKIAIVGGGPSGMFMLKRLIEAGDAAIEVTIFERGDKLGSGMPYSRSGALREHITNVSGNEIPAIVTTVADWIATVPEETLNQYGISANHFNEYKVLPRLLFGEYLSAQFALLLEQAADKKISTQVYLDTPVIDILPDQNQIVIQTETETLSFDSVVICTGHQWPKKHEGKIKGYFDSPYPPSKIALRCNHAVAIKGSSLTAIDAIRTLARHNGRFERDANKKVTYQKDADSPLFRIAMHSRSGMLPAVRFHLEDTHLQNDSLLTPDEIAQHLRENDGFLSLDYLFDNDFKEAFREKQPEFYERIRDIRIEEFVTAMMELRETLDPFVLLRAEYAEAEKSIRRHESVYWKEMLAVLSFAMNYPAKHLPAEDMLRLQKVLMPLISLVIAFIPQASCEELLALHDAGVLENIAVGNDSKVRPEIQGGATYSYRDEAGIAQSVYYKTFVDCVGQPHLSVSDFPFQGLVDAKAVSPARVRFKDPEAGIEALASGNANVEVSAGMYYLNVPGITINDSFQVLDQYGAYSETIYIMAVPFIGGLNPDYSGLDFCEAASEKIASRILTSNN